MSKLSEYRKIAEEHEKARIDYLDIPASFYVYVTTNGGLCMVQYSPMGCTSVEINLPRASTDSFIKFLRSISSEETTK